LAILGDLGHPHLLNYKDFFRQAAAEFDHVFYISGNHEYYSDESIDVVNDRIHECVSEFDNVYFLNNQGIYFDNVKILDTMMWSKIPPTIPLVSNDYRHIKKEGVFITPVIVNNMYQDNVNFLQHHLSNSDPDQSLVVLTHHLPSYQLIAPRFKHFKYPFLFAS